MNLQRYNILIVDDDKTFGESLKAAVTRAGFRAYLVNSPEDALAYVKLQDVHGVVIDCMLPKMNGLDLYKHMASELTGDPCVILMSGIFKDKQFINSSKKSTGAVEFFTKPFDHALLINSFKSHFLSGDEGDSELNPLVDLYLNRDVKPRKLIRTINGCEGLHNYDLPWVFRLLATAKATGHLNIACTNGDIAGVGFQDGEIVQVNIKQEESLLGLLLCDHGYLDRDDLDSVLAKKTEHQRIGQLLIQENYVSPHAIDIVLKEQIVWRMRGLIADSQMEINFVTSDQVSPIVTITENDLANFFYETMESTIPGDWIKTHYIPLVQNIVGLNPDNKARIDHLRSLPFVAKIFPAIESPLNRGTTLEEILGQHQQHEEIIWKVIHYLNISNCLRFTQVQKNANLNHQIKRLQKLEVDLEEKNYFERLGVSRSAKEADIKRAYFDLAKVLHPDKALVGTPTQVVDLSKKVFEKIQLAYETLKKDDLKETYLRELEVGQAEKLIKADQVIEEARNHLVKGEITQAAKALKQAKTLNPDSVEMSILTIWCDIKASKSPSDRFKSDVEKRLQQIPLESRDSASYYHTRGLFFVLFGDTVKAAKYFSTALKIDNGFINSRRELNLVQNKKTSKNIFKSDFKDVVGMFFKKKSG